MIKIVVFGGTGFAGSRIAAESQRRGHDVTVVARNLPKDQSAAVQFVPGSVFDPEFRVGLLREADVAVVSVRSYDPASPVLADVIGDILAEAAESNTCIGVVGGAGSLSSVEGGPSLIEQANIADPTELRSAEGLGHARVLEALRADTSGADWFYLSPPTGFGSWLLGEATGTYRIGDDVLLVGSDGKSEISAHDYALALIDEIDEPRHHRTRFTVAH